MIKKTSIFKIEYDAISCTLTNNIVGKTAKEVIHAGDYFCLFAVE